MIHVLSNGIQSRDCRESLQLQFFINLIHKLGCGITTLTKTSVKYFIPYVGTFCIWHIKYYYDTQR